MKTMNLSLILLIVGLELASAQLPDFFRDDFNDNINKWDIFDNNNVSADVRMGNFVIACKTSKMWRFLKPIYLDQRNDFYIEAKVTHKLGVHDEGYGLVWGAKDKAYNYNFMITSSGYFKIHYYKKEQLNTITEWQKVDNLNPSGQANVLAVEKKAKNLNFYINGKLVHSTNYQYFFGKNIGFVLGQNLTISVDYLLIKHPPIKIETDKAITKHTKEHLNTNINSVNSEIAPVISPDGKTLYVARKNHPNNIKYGFYDIWVSQMKNDGSWNVLQRLGNPLNNAGDNIVTAVMPDGNTLLLEGVYNADASSASDQGISLTYRTAQSWAIPTELKIKNFYNYNEYESYYPSTDRQVLLLSVERDDTYGSKDIYVSFLHADGTYSEPKNIGPEVNTYENEGTPFLAADGKTLYFYSDEGFPGYGSTDIFVTKRLDDTWTNWSSPKNIGAQINNQNWNTYFSIPASGDYAYFCSSENGFGEEDIYRIKLEVNEKPEPVVLLTGKILDKNTNKPIQAEIVYEDLEKHIDLGRALSNPSTGAYKIVLPYGRNYGIRANAKNYFSSSENVDTKELTSYQELTKDIYLSPVEVGQVVVLNNIFFDRGKSNLRPESYPELDRVAEFLTASPNIEIEIGGHTEITHSDPKLSQDRAKVVMDYIVKKGIDQKRIASIGYANTRPVTDDYSTEESRQRNRRVEFKILKK